jgi:hypothetical protein
MKRILFAAVIAVGLLSLPAFAADTDTASINITVADIYMVSLDAGADWTYTLLEADYLAGEAVSANLTDVMDVAGNAAYEVTAQMSVPTWDAAIALQANVDAAGWTTLLDSAPTVITGLDNEVAGAQSDLDLQWRLTGITWANTSSGDDWTCTVTFTCQANV